jgi:nitrogen fixation protein NifQ
VAPSAQVLSSAADAIEHRGVACDSQWLRSRDRLLAAAQRPLDPATLAFAGVIARTHLRPAPYAVPVAGLGEDALARLIASRFPALAPAVAAELLEAQQGSRTPDAQFDEFEDVVALLLEHRSGADESSAWLAHAIATASMASDHLWQDMGLPARKVLNQLLAEHFTTLYLKNVGDMKWKKFFYRQLCERAQVPICRSPSCSTCVDFTYCFGPEDAPEPGWLRQVAKTRTTG